MRHQVGSEIGIRHHLHVRTGITEARNRVFIGEDILDILVHTIVGTTDKNLLSRGLLHQTHHSLHRTLIVSLGDVGNQVLATSPIVEVPLIEGPETIREVRLNLLAHIGKCSAKVIILEEGHSLTGRCLIELRPRC